MDIENSKTSIENGEKTIRTPMAGNEENQTNMHAVMELTSETPEETTLDGLCCPFCGVRIDADADFCESCHRYIKNDVCSYCGVKLNGTEPYCPECGSPRGGIVCPVCHTMNDFAFCKICGTPLTDEAKTMSEEIKRNPDYIELIEAVEELERLDMCLPYNSDRDIVKEQINEKLRERVFKLLSDDCGMQMPELSKRVSKRMPVDALNSEKNAAIAHVTELLERLAIVQAVSPVKARNYAMATKPAGVRLAWMCNYKNAMHSSPCGCAKPHLGGKWVVLGKGATGHVKDDN